jgi:hypothetical protein
MPHDTAVNHSTSQMSYIITRFKGMHAGFYYCPYVCSCGNTPSTAVTSVVNLMQTFLPTFTLTYVSLMARLLFEHICRLPLQVAGGLSRRQRNCQRWAGYECCKSYKRNAPFAGRC